MTDVLLGNFDVTASFTEGYVRSEANLSPGAGARLCTSGTRPMLITDLRGRVSGRGATRTLEMYLGGSSVNLSRASSGSAQDTGWQNSNNWLAHYGDTPNYGYRDMSGSCYFGRDNSGFAQGAFGTFPGDLGMYYRYVQSPNAPGTPTVTPIDASSATVSWTAPGDNGGAAISGYSLQRALDAGFTTGLTTIGTVGASTVVTGLDGGTDYYYRVTAKNAATVAEGALGGTWSATKKATQPQGSIGEIFVGGLWVPAQGKIFIDGAWVEAAGKIFDGAVWLDL